MTEMVSFTPEDFDVFAIPGLEARMEALIAAVRPKLTALGEQLAPELSLLTGDEMFPHVAKHARRKVNPPNDTWVAWAANKKGYKMLPHFQTGLFETHLFAQFAIIYESSNKRVFGDALRTRTETIKSIVPAHFAWSTNHLKADVTLHSEMTDEDFERIADQLASAKQSEVMVGIRLNRDDALLRDGAALRALIRDTFETLMPLYRMSF